MHIGLIIIIIFLQPKVMRALAWESSYTKLNAFKNLFVRIATYVHIAISVATNVKAQNKLSHVFTRNCLHDVIC